MFEKQNLLVRACGLVTIMFVIDWEKYESYFEVSCRGYKVAYDNLLAAYRRFKRLCEKERKREEEEAK